MQVQLRSINIGSAFKFGATYSALMFAIIILPTVLCQVLFLSTAAVADPSAFEAEGIDPALFSSLGVAGLCIGGVVGIFFYALVGGISSAIGALIYNFVSGRVGGLEFKLEDLGGVDYGGYGGGDKSKRGDTFEF